jgi:hypothetical protein
MHECEICVSYKQDFEVQSFSCTATAGSFSVQFRGFTTVPIVYSETLSTFATVLESLDSYVGCRIIRVAMCSMQWLCQDCLRHGYERWIYSLLRFCCVYVGFVDCCVPES